MRFTYMCFIFHRVLDMNDDYLDTLKWCDPRARGASLCTRVIRCVGLRFFFGTIMEDLPVEVAY